MSQKLLSPGPLLDNKGNLIEPGYAFSLVRDYDRKCIKKKWRIKEWDYYYIGDTKYGIALTIADNSYMSLMGVSVFDFENKKEWTKSYMGWLTFGCVGHPGSSKNGDLFYESKKFSMYFKNENGKRRLVCSMKNVVKGQDFECDVYLTETSPHSMVIATPFKKKKHFYYNQKINNLAAKGSFKFGPLQYTFSKDALGVLDWGRGVWTYSNTWYWSSLNAKQDGHNVGFNLGYGFGDTSAASENMFFYDDKVYKLDDVKFEIPLDEKGRDNFLATWKVTSEKGDINLTFEPLFNRHADTNAIIIRSNQSQVFGKFSGEITVEGKTYTLNNLIGFAEKVMNRW